MVEGLATQGINKEELSQPIGVAGVCKWISAANANTNKMREEMREKKQQLQEDKREVSKVFEKGGKVGQESKMGILVQPTKINLV